MQRTMMKSKIHRATVTDTNVDYVGSITLDPDLMAAADILEFEQVARARRRQRRPVRDVRDGRWPGDVILTARPRTSCSRATASS